MRYDRVLRGTFIDRPNRFLAHVEAEGELLTCHVKNTGRCRELLRAGAAVWLHDRRGRSGRRTDYDLICAEKDGRLVNIDSQAPNRAAGEWLRGGALLPPGSVIRAESRWGDSRFDFSALDPAGGVHLLEVKGVTLEREGLALFPDAPTLRGARHLRTLAEAAEQGIAAYVLFVVQMQGAERLSPNDGADPAFAAALRRAAGAGVQILARDCRVRPDSMEINAPIPVVL